MLEANGVLLPKIKERTICVNPSRITMKSNKPLPLDLVINQYVCLRNADDIVFEGYVSSVSKYSLSLTSYFKFDSEYIYA